MTFDMTALEPLIGRVARSVSNSFPSHYDVQDTEQELWVWAAENENTIASIARNTERPEGILYDLMTKEAHKFLKKEDQATYGYSEDDVFNYTTEAVRTLLGSVFDYEDWQSFGAHGDGQPKARKQANQTGDMVASLIDVKSAVEGLNEDQYNVIVWTYKYFYTAENLGTTLGISEQAAKKRLERAVQAVRRRLGGKPFSDMRRGFSGRRVALGNAEANAITNRDYEG